MKNICLRLTSKKNGSYSIKTVRFPEGLSERLSQIAAEEGVSFNELVVQCCLYAIDDYVSEADVKVKEEARKK